MTLHVQISISDEGGISPREQAVLNALAGAQPVTTQLDVTPDEKSEVKPEPEAVEEKPAPRRRRAATPKPEEKPAPEPEPEVEADDASEADEDLVGDDGPTLQDAINKAQDMMKAGKAADVKAALKEVGATKVSLLEGGQIAAFLAEVE